MKDFSFSHRTHRSYRALLRTVSIPQKASGIQNSQNVTAIFNTKKGHIEAYILSIGVSRCSLPFPLGEGTGEGPAGDGGGAYCDIVLSRYSFHPPFSFLHPFTVCQYFYSSQSFHVLLLI